MSSVRTILPLSPPKRSSRLEKMTELEFVDWCDNDTWAEWMDGEVLVIPAVELTHARITAFLSRLIGDFAEEHNLGETLSEPFQVRFARLRRRRSPDIIFISHDRSKQLRPMHFEGGPDLIVEVVSGESQSRDRREKYIEYESAGVREYWIVDPLVRDIEVYLLGRNKKFSKLAMTDGLFHSAVLPGFYVKPAWLWQLKPPRVAELLKEMSRKR